MEPMQTITPSPVDTLGALAARIPAASRVFREAGLDYCCGGKQTLADACAAKGIDPEALLRSIRETGVVPVVSWEGRPLAELVAHILETYHQPLRLELPALGEMAALVEEKHADKPSCPKGLARHLESIHEAVLSHLEKEEQILFPLILAGRGSQAHGPIQVMETEHVDHGVNLARMRALTHDFVPPPEACATWKALYPVSYTHLTLPTSDLV